ncbi:MAG: hypothetical protein GXP32_02335 [Kiritimatiellaeota bacterium]|nr:hypothetical protein [Kiritimatiellota bacterium]
MKKLIGLSFVVIASFWLGGCHGATGSYTSNEKFGESVTGPLEKNARSYQGIYRNPVIIVHGFLGSNMLDKKSGENIWGEFSGSDGFALPDWKIRALALPMVMHKPLKDLKDDTVPNGALNTVKVKIFGITFTENAYLNLVDALHEGGYQLEGRPLDSGKNFFNLFQFSYDWRRDLQESAAKLHEYLMRKRKYIQKQYEALYGVKDYDVHFDLIGHSMGGLVSRYYLRYGTADLPELSEKPNVTWAGAKYVDRLIILGTPSAGYLDTLLEMQKGTEMPPFPPALLSTWLTYYQMLPDTSTKSVVYKNNPSTTVDIYDFQTWIKMKWGLASPKQEEVFKVLMPNVKSRVKRRLIAFDHLKKCLKRAKRFKRAMNLTARHPDSLKMYLVLGNAVKTTRRAEVDEKGELKVVDYGPGDGKVLASSAMYDERDGQKTWLPFFYSPIYWNSIIQLRAAHMGITTDPAFKDNVLFLLNSMPSTKYQYLIDEYRKNNPK